MRRADFASDAEYYRAHRQVFLLAQELGCTPAEAERRMKAEQARMRDLAARNRLERRVNAPLQPGMPELRNPRSGGPNAPLHEAPAWNAPWMLQE